MASSTLDSVDDEEVQVRENICSSFHARPPIFSSFFFFFSSFLLKQGGYEATGAFVQSRFEYLLSRTLIFSMIFK